MFIVKEDGNIDALRRLYVVNSIELFQPLAPSSEIADAVIRWFNQCDFNLVPEKAIRRAVDNELVKRGFESGYFEFTNGGIHELFC